MKKLFLIVIIILLYACLQQEETKVKVLNPIINIKKRKPLQIVDTTFQIQNIGNNNLIIKDVKSDCLCTVVEWTKDSIPKNKTGYIRIIYNNKNKGYFQQSIYVDINVKNAPIILLLQGRTI